MKYEHILFDIDDTLFDFKKAEKTALKNLFEKNGLEFNGEFLKKYRSHNNLLWEEIEKGTRTVRDLPVLRFDGLVDEKLFKSYEDYLKFSEGYIDELCNCAFVYDDTESLLESLYGKCHMYIVTNGVKRVQDSRLEKAGLRKYFDGVYISESIGHQKPSKEFFDCVFSDANIKDKSKCIILGDSFSSDMRGGRNAGIATCRICRESNTKDKNPLCDYEIKKLSEFIDIVK